MRRGLIIAAGLLGMLVSAAGLVVQWPYQGFSKEALIDIPRGSSTRAIAELLAAKGVVRSPAHFLLARVFQPRAVLQAGEYSFSSPASASAVLSRIARGDVHYYELVVPEGSNMFDIARGAEQLGIFRAPDFLKAANDPARIRDLAPRAPSLEGYLFPSTYRLTRTTTPAQLCQMMTAKFRAEWKDLARKGVVMHDVVTLASLVEKETGAAPERKLVSSVFHNRLGRGMKLECDPTTIYAALLEGRWRGKIHRSDLNSDHPYNTYRHGGLPPGPIANPGRAAIQAALDPDHTDYIFFVAKPGGGVHQFSANSAGHAQAVREYRQGTRAQPKRGARR